MAASLRILAKGKLSTMQPVLRAAVRRTNPVILSRGLAVTSTRLSRIPTDAELLTGLEKKEYDAIAAGIDIHNIAPKFVRNHLQWLGRVCRMDDNRPAKQLQYCQLVCESGPVGRPKDPFNMKPYKGPPGTKDKPLEVLSMQEDRIIGCVCEPDATSIVWRKLTLNKVTRCDCGHFFVLRRGNPINIPFDVPVEDHHH